MRRSSFYALGRFILKLQCDATLREHLENFLQALSWVPIDGSVKQPSLALFIERSDGEFGIPGDCREVLRTVEFLGFEADGYFFLTDGASGLRLDMTKGRGYARIAPSFFRKTPIVQANFWCFGLLKLLRPLSVYGLHGAGLSTKGGEGVLLVGPSGSGKSTLAIGLIRAGWSYLSDDALLLGYGPAGIEALACRKGFYIDAGRSAAYSELPLGQEEPDCGGGRRRRLGIEKTFPQAYVARCVPRIVIFPRIAADCQSRLSPVDRACALGLLLAQSGPQLFDRSSMSGHLRLLKKLLRQSEAYELEAGSDLYHRPAELIDLLARARGAEDCRASSLS